MPLAALATDATHNRERARLLALQVLPQPGDSSEDRPPGNDTANPPNITITALISTTDGSAYAGVQSNGLGIGIWKSNFSPFANFSIGRQKSMPVTSAAVFSNSSMLKSPVPQPTSRTRAPVFKSGCNFLTTRRRQTVSIFADSR